WGSCFANWEAVHFSSEAELYGGPENPSAWVDFRLFINRVFADTLASMRETIRQIHPGAAVGWDGVENYSSYDGIDYWQITRGMDLVQMYQTALFPGRYPSKIFN